MSRIFLLVFSLFFFVSTYSQAEIYELRIYEMDFFKPEKVLHDYFQNALIPALNRQGVQHVGVFEELGQALPKKIYVLITYDDILAFSGVEAALLKDATFTEAADSYLNAPPEEIPFKRVSPVTTHSPTV